MAGLYGRRWLIWYFIVRQLTQSYRSSYLGILWIFLGPLLMVALFTAVFSEILDLKFRDTEGLGVVNYGLYVYCGLIPFMAYSGTVNKAVGIIRQNSALVRRMVFPLEILPFSATVANILDQVFGFAALLVLAVALGQGFHWTVFLIPLVMVPQLLFNLGLGYLGAVVGAYLPDVQEMMRAVVRATFWVTPIIWPASQAENKSVGWLKLSWVVDYNPVAILVEAYRALVLEGLEGQGLEGQGLEGRLPDLTQVLLWLTPLLWLTLFSAALCAVTFWLFMKVRHSFGDLV